MLGPTEFLCVLETIANWTSWCKGGEQVRWNPLAQRKILSSLIVYQLSWDKQHGRFIW